MATTIDETSGTIREEYVTPPLRDSEQLQRLRPALDSQYAEDVTLPLGPRVRWGGLFAGVVAAFAVILLLTMLGIALGVLTVDNSLFANRGDTQNFTTSAGIWAGVSALMAYLVAGMVATQVTDRPDGGALLHGVLAWMLLSMTVSGLATSGMALGFGNLPDELLPRLSRNAGPVNPQDITEMEIAQRLGLASPSQLLDPALDEHMVSALATTTNMPREEAQVTLDNLRAQVASVQNDLAAVYAEISAFLSQMVTRVQQQAPTLAAPTGRQLENGSWMTFAVMAITLMVTIMGARAGVPDSRRWRRRALRL